MQDCNVITKGSYSEFRFNDFVSVRQYLLVREQGKKYLLLKLSNDGPNEVSSIKLSVKQLDVRGDVIKTGTYQYDKINAKPGEKFVLKDKIPLVEGCVEVGVTLDEAHFGNYTYAVKSNELVVTYEPKKKRPKRNFANKIEGGEKIATATRTFKVPKIIAIMAIIMVIVAMAFTIVQLMHFKKTETEFLWSGVNYEFVDHDKKGDGSEIKVISVSSTTRNVKVPAEILGHPVTEIGDEVFQWNDKIRTVTIESEVAIGANAFVGCTALEEVTFTGVTAIGENAFKDCTDLTTFTATNLDSIGASAFVGCTKLETVNISNAEKVLAIGEGAFKSSIELKDVVIDQAVVYGLKSNFFAEGIKVENLHLENFNNQEIEIESGSNKKLISLFAIEEGGIATLKTLTIDNIDFIPEAFLKDMPELTSVKLGGLKSGVVSKEAFFNCEKLSSVTLLAAKTEGEVTGESTANLEVTEIYKNAFTGTAIKEFDANKVIVLEDEAFKDCASLISITFDQNTTLEEMGESVFEGCTSLSAVRIPTKLTELPDKTFKCCSLLKEVSFANLENITVISESVFEDCTSLQVINIPKSIAKISSKAFKGCTALMQIPTSAKLKTIGESAFEGCTALTSVVVPDTVENIELGAFKDCSAMTDYTAPGIGGVKFNKFMAYVFGVDTTETLTGAETTELPTIINMPQTLETVKITKNLAEIPEYAFYGCLYLKEIVLTTPEKIGTGQNYEVGKGAFYLCVSLEKMPDISYCHSIGAGAFAYCTTLSTVEFSSSLAKIGALAFEGCTGLTEITVPGNVKSIGKGAFKGIDKLEKITLPFVGGGNNEDSGYMGYLFDVDKAESNDGEFSADELQTFRENMNDYESVPKTLKEIVIDYVKVDSDDEGKTIYISEPSMNIEILYECAFFGMENVKNIVLPDLVMSDDGEKQISKGITVVSAYAFAYCVKLETALMNVDRFGVPNLIVSKNLDVIEKGAFLGCVNLREVEIPETATCVDDTAFEECYLLFEIYNASSLHINSSYVGIDTYTMTVYNGTKAQIVDNGGMLKKVEKNGFTFIQAGDVEDVYGSNIVANQWYLSNYIGGSDNWQLPESFVYEEKNSSESSTLITVDSYRLVAHIFEHRDDVKYITVSNSVYAINEYAFSDCENLETVTFASGSIIEDIPDYAFYKSPSLTQVTLAGVAKTIGQSAFEGCEKLDTFAFSDELETIGAKAFKDCKALQNVWLNENLKTIEEGTFAGTGITSIVIPNTVETVKTGAFEGCEALTDIVFGTNVTSIGLGAIKDCTSITSLTIPTINDIYIASIFGVENNASVVSSLKKIVVTNISDVPSQYFSSLASVEEIVFDASNSNVKIGSAAFNGCTALTSVSIYNVTEIGNDAFNGCSSLASVALDSTKTIGERAFYNCSSLQSVNLEKVESIGSSAFESSGVTSVTMPKLETVSEAAFRKCANLTGVYIEKVNTIEAEAFRGCALLATAAMRTVNSIGMSAFAASGIQEVDTPNVTFIGVSAFYECGSLASIDLGDKEKKIQENAFAYCNVLTSVSLNNVYLSGSAFAYCAALNNVYVSNATIGNNAFMSCGALNSVSISNAESIGSDAFDSCSSLSSATLTNVKNIGSNAFENCSALTAITITGTTDTILGDGVFIGCNSLKTATLSSVVSIGGSAFSSCSSLATVNAPKATTIGSYAFNNCALLNSVSISKVTSIGDNAFEGCIALVSIALPDTLTEINGYAFNGCSSLAEISLPYGLVTIANYAFQSCSALKTVWFNGKVSNMGTYAFSNCTNLFEIYDIGGNDFTTNNNGNEYLGNYALIVHTSSAAPRLQSYVDGGKTFYYSGDNCILYKYEGDEKDVVLGSVTINGKTYSNYSIYRYAFYNNDNIETLRLNAVSKIGDNAFADCYNLKSVTLGSSVKEIGSWAFGSCSKLYEVYDLSSNVNVSVGGNDNGRIGYYAVKVNTDKNADTIQYHSENNFDFMKIDGVWFLYGYSGGESQVTLPTGLTINGTKVTSYYLFGGGKYNSNVNGLFKYNYNISSLIIPTNVTKIMPEAITYNGSNKYVDIYYYGNSSGWDNVEYDDNQIYGVGSVYYYHKTCVHDYSTWTMKNGSPSTALTNNYEWKVTTAPTCQAKGLNTNTCLDCGHKDGTKETNIVDHDFSSANGKCKWCSLKKLTEISGYKNQVTVTNDTSNPFALDTSGNIVTSSKDKDDTSTLKITAKVDVEITIKFKFENSIVSDTVSIKVGDQTPMGYTGGNTNVNTKTLTLKAGDTVTIEHKKHNGQLKITDITVEIIETDEDEEE